MVLEAETVLDDVRMCEACYSSYDDVAWIDIGPAPVRPGERSPDRASQAMD